MQLNGRQPNFLLILTDQQRYPPPYESDAIKGFRQEFMPGQEAIRQYAVEFNRHYAASTACAPSRTSLFTGHYPSLHRVSQTDGVFKHANDPDMHWLEPGTIPTLGNYFRTAGYRTIYKGKWHVSEANLEANDAPIWAEDGSQSRESIENYLRVNPLDAYGFSDWVGPEPHGRSKFNTGVNRDVGFAQQAIETIDRLEQDYRAGQTAPWFMVTSFLNPHDIALYGVVWMSYRYHIMDERVPAIDAAPTAHEDLSTKPACHQNYVDVYGKLFGPQRRVQSYYRLYYTLQMLVDQHINAVYERLKRSVFFEDTVVVFSSDHGEMLRSHGGMQQKWHNTYEESLHVPLMISNPLLFSKPASIDTLTSHIDLMPTLLGLAGLDREYLRTVLSRTHRLAEPLIGRDLVQTLLGKTQLSASPLYFMTEDEISEGQNHRRIQVFYKPISQPNHIESVFAELPTGVNGHPQVWKYSRYFDNPEFWTVPFDHDEIKQLNGVKVKTAPMADEFEMYNLSADPLEQMNLAHASVTDAQVADIQRQLAALLAEQRSSKRLSLDA